MHFYLIIFSPLYWSFKSFLIIPIRSLVLNLLFVIQLHVQSALHCSLWFRISSNIKNTFLIIRLHPPLNMWWFSSRGRAMRLQEIQSARFLSFRSSFLFLKIIFFLSYSLFSKIIFLKRAMRLQGTQSERFSISCFWSSLDSSQKPFPDRKDPIRPILWSTPVMCPFNVSPPCYPVGDNWRTGDHWWRSWLLWNGSCHNRGKISKYYSV